MATTPHGRDSQQPASRTQGPPSEGAFIGALRDHALFSVDLASSGGVLGLSQIELEEQSDLSRPSVTGLINRFEPILQGQDDGGAPMLSKEGADRWTIDPDAGVVVAVQIADETFVGVSDLYGRTEESAVPHKAQMTPDEIVDSAVDEINMLLRGRPASDVVGVGVSVAGPVDQKAGQIRAELASAGGSAADWQLLKIREHLRRRLGWDDLPFLVENDANLGALAEYVFGAGRPSRLGDRSPYANVVYLEWSLGIGAGLILQGQLYRGAGVAGEIGHTIVQPDGQICPLCGRSGCLEMVAGWKAIREHLFDSTDPASEQQDLAEAIRLADEPNSDAAKAFAEAADQIGRVLGPVIHLLNPELVIIGGDVGRQGYDVVKTPLLKSLKHYTMRPALADVTIVPAKLRKHPTLQGAVSLMLRPPAKGDPNALLTFLQKAKAAKTAGASPGA